eukprot:scaffold913_cov186-Alexandrium_tamarense.AAC.8
MLQNSLSSCPHTLDNTIQNEGVSIPCGFVTAADVGLSNLSLVRISITFFTMIKSSSPIWVLLSAFIFGIEKVSCNLITVGMMIMAGELLTAFGEVDFDTVGFMLCAGAAVCSGIRWTLVQLKVQTLDPPLKGSIVIMRVLASSMFFFMLLLSFTIERPWEKLSPENGDYFTDSKHAMKTISLGLTGAAIAIAMSEDPSTEVENNGQFARVQADDVYEDEPSPRQLKRARGEKNSDPDLAMRFKIEDDDMDEKLVLDMARASLRGRNGGGSNAALEIDSKAITIV